MPRVGRKWKGRTVKSHEVAGHILAKIDEIVTSNKLDTVMLKTSPHPDFYTAAHQMKEYIAALDAVTRYAAVEAGRPIETIEVVRSTEDEPLAVPIVGKVGDKP